MQTSSPLCPHVVAEGASEMELEGVGEGPGIAMGSEDNDSSSSSSSSSEQMPEWMVAEDPEQQQEVWLVTFAKILEDTALTAKAPLKVLDNVSRPDILAAMMDAIAHPVVTTGGRPRKNALKAVKMVVFLEKPKHFHVALKVSSKICFLPYKRALRERSGLASHWSGSHTQWWSAVRYGHVPSEHKPEVDEDPLCYPEEMNLYEASQEHWNAVACKKRREQAAARALAGPQAKKAREGKFDGMELKNLILAEKLFTPAAIIVYAQEKADAQCRTFIGKNQKKLKEWIEEAKEWRDAPERAAWEALTPWELVQNAASETCPFCKAGKPCTWTRAFHSFFKRNKGIDRKQLAQATAKIIVEGPGKTTRVPLLVGHSNSGKSTVYDPVDPLFGKVNVFHTPAMASMALASLGTKVKVFAYLDDYRFIEYACFPKQAPAVPVPTLLKFMSGQAFEVKVSGSFAESNPDITWDKGMVITAKAEGLWDLLTDTVSREDVRHIKNRVLQFTADGAPLEDGALKKTHPCKVCFAKWLIADSQETSVPATPAPQPSPTLPDQLDEYLKGVFEAANLEVKLELAAAWCQEMGADEPVDLVENFADFCEALSLKPLQEKRLRKVMATVLVLEAASVS